MLRHPILAIPIFALLAAADAIHSYNLATGRPASIPIQHDHNLAGHAIDAFLAALLGAAALTQATKLTRLTLFLFFLVLTLSLPVLGILLTAALALVLRRPATGGVRPEERFVFGNPEAAAARPASPRPFVTLTPLAEGFRSMDEDTLCQAILGLKHLGPPRALAPFLQRFQQDPRTSVQFTAQAVLSSATETLEETIRTLRQRLTADPTDLETRLALADTLEQLTAWTPPGDATTAIRRREATALVTDLLTARPDESRALRLLARLQLAAAHGSAAEETAHRLAHPDPAGDSAAHQALLESLFHQARWDDLAAAARLTPPPPGQAEPHAFWTTTPPHRS
jgi:hypothetical protein